MSYIWNHSRCSPNGTAYKVWEKMFTFVTGEAAPCEEQAMPLFTAHSPADHGFDAKGVIGHCEMYNELMKEVE